MSAPLWLQVGARLHQRSFELLQECWGAWQLFVLQAQAHRRAAMLWNAAEAFRWVDGFVSAGSLIRHPVDEGRAGRMRDAIFRLHAFFAAVCVNAYVCPCSLFAGSGSCCRLACRPSGMAGLKRGSSGTVRPWRPEGLLGGGAWRPAQVCTAHLLHMSIRI